MRMEVITAYNFVVDSNIESPSGKSPSAAHLGVRIFNDGTVPLTNVVVRIGDLLDANTSSGNAGTFESRTVSFSGQYAGTFALQMPGGAADAVRVIPRIEPGQYVAQYFFVTYPLKDPSGNSVTGAANVTSDDLWLNYDIWAHANDGVTTRRVEKTNRVTMRNEISAMANKIWPNTGSKVPDKYLAAFESTLGWRPDNSSPRIPGANVMEGIWYDLGNIGAGFDNNGDGIPDRNAWLQPVGDPALFSPLAARMVKCYGIVIVKLNNGTEMLIPFEDRLYFENMPENNTGAVGLVYYEFLPLNLSLPNRLTPYQEVASGYDNEKFNSDFGGVVGSAVTQPAEAQIVKTGPATRATGQNADYVLTVTNTGSVTYGWPDLSLPVVIEDPIPAGLQYVAGSATAGPNGTNPAGGVFTVHYSTDHGATWSTSEPVPASAVNRLRWVLDRSLQPGHAATVRFSALVPTGFTPFQFTNTGILKSGTETEVDRDTWTTVRTGINQIGDFIWRDLDRDGVQDGGAETGLPQVRVSLYVDSSGNGLLDNGEPLYGAVNTDTNGAYLFSNLPDARYIVVVDTADTDLPYGYKLKSGVSDRYAFDLDSAGTNSSAVNFLTADWPFIQGLEVTKTVSPTTYLGGDLITYQVHLDNHMATLQVPEPGTQTAFVPSTAFDKTNAAAKTTENQAAGAPNNLFTYLDWNANADRIVTGAFPGSPPPFTPVGGTINKVELVVRGYLSIPFTDNRIQLGIEVGHVNRPIAAFGTPLNNTQLNALVGVSQDLVIEITGASASWTWAQVQSLSAALVAGKTGGPGATGDFYVDSIGFRVTTNNLPFTGTFGPNTIVEWPLKDVYDPDKLEFVFASVQPDVTGPAGTLEWYNLGPVNAGARKTVSVTFRAKTPTDTNSDGRRDPMVANNTVTTQGTSLGDVPLFATGQPAGHDDGSVNVTINPAGRIGDFVYWDINRNNAYNLGVDVPLQGVIVQLFQGGVYTGRSAITNAGGFYEFIGLSDGTYEVRITTSTTSTTSDLYSLPWVGASVTSTQRGTALTTISSNTFVAGDSVTLNNSDFLPGNDVNFSQDFGFDSDDVSVISGKLFRDWNGNGVQDPGDEPLVGASISLSGVTNPVFTDANGFYQFSNITTIGNRTVTVNAPPASHTQTLDPDTTLNNATTINVVLGNAYLNRNFAYRPTGSLTIGDTLYYDWNGDSVQNIGENGIANVEMRLYEDANGDGNVNVDDALVASVNTSSSGVYQFASLFTGNYIVMVNVADTDFPISYLQTQDYDGVKDDTAKINLVTSLSTVDFGYKPIGTAAMGNLVWLDANNNGLKETTEAGIDGVTVQLYRAGQTPGVDTAVATSVTSGGGIYSFSALPAGSYFMAIAPSHFGAGQPLQMLPWSSTITNAGDSQIDGDDNGIQNGAGQMVTSPVILLAPGENDLSVDFGFTGSGAAGDFVFYDTNGNGAQDFNEPGIGNVTVRIFTDLNQDGLADGLTPYASVVSSQGGDGNPVGFYRFTNLPPGTYLISVDTATLPVGVVYTSDPDRSGIPVGQAPINPPGDHADSLVLVSIGSSYAGADFGYKPTGAVGDFVWLDLNQNGIADSGEPGLANVALQITNGTTTFNASTDFDGYWSAILPDGSWTVQVTAANFQTGAALASMIPTHDADTVASPNTTSIVVNGGQVVTPASLPQGNLGLDFGYRLDGLYGISGTVVLHDTRVSGVADDIDNLADDGVDMDAGPLDEMELGGVTVYLYQQGGMFLGTEITDAAGNYSFSGLPAGNYRVIIGTTQTPLSFANLTTTAANNAAVINLDSSSGTTVIQTVEVADTVVTDVDFAFVTDVSFDFGDLPLSYGMVSLAQDGARHRIPAGGSSLWLGTAPDAEVNAIAHPQAAGDDIIGTDDDDGVTAVAISSWSNGTVTNGQGGTLQIAVNGSGWLVGWIDWNNDGDFLDAGEFVANQAVSTGTVTASFGIPAGTITGGSQSWLSRFRLFPGVPAFPLFSYAGEAMDGEVEDHLLEIPVGGSVGDLVWNDKNGNGLQDGTENGIAGVVVELLNPLNQVIATQTTGNGAQDVDGDGLIDPPGAYRFRGLAAGTYQVRIPAPPAGYAPTYDEDGTTSPSLSTVVLVAQQQHLTADFGYQGNASIGDLVWIDNNGNGVTDSGEQGLANVRVYLDSNQNGSWNAGEPFVVTDSSGAYEFSALLGGDYTVAIDTGSLPAGLALTGDPDSTLDHKTVVILANGQNHDTADFGYQGNAGIGDFVWYDVDGDGVQDVGEPALENVRLYLDLDDDAVLDANEPSVLTSSLGAYGFSGLVPGTYVIRVETSTLPVGMTASYDQDGIATQNRTSVVLADATTRTDIDFGYQGTVVLVGNLYIDTNGNGDQDGGEPNLPDVDVLITDSLGVERTVMTDSSGNWLVAVVAGNASADIDETDPEYPSGYSQTEGSDPTVTNALVGTTNNGGIDGFYQSATMTGHLYIDTNGDGNQDVGEPNLANVNVLITDVNSNVQTVTTDSNGDWTAIVPPGSTIPNIDESDPEYPTGYTQTEGTDPTNVLAVAGTSTSAGNDGFFLPASIKGFVRIDTDGNATGDAPQVGVLVELFTNAGVLVSSVLTGTDGRFSFPNLAPGSYKKVQTVPNNYIAVNDADGGDFTVIGNLAPVVLNAGDNVTDQNFVNSQSASITGNVFNDLNRLADNTVNGTGTNGGGIHINLVNPVGDIVLASIPVNVDGTYSFTQANGVQINSSYRLVLTANAVTIGATLTASTLPVPWFSTGENLGAVAGNDGSVNAILAVSTTVGVETQANFGIVQAPDITPVITAQPNVMNGPTDFNIRVQVNELYQKDTEGTIVVRIPKDARWSLREAFDGNLVELDGVSLENNKWTHSENETQHIFTTVNSGVVIPAGGLSRFGIKARWVAEAQEGIYTISVQIDSFSGNEIPINNNSDADKIDFFDK